jgi:penicillin amidase
MNVLKNTVIALVVLSLFPIAVYVFMRIHLPDIDGTFYSESIQKKVMVIRDNWGVPHISAENGRDAYFAYGFTIAQDRLFQMELHRRIARGEIAELFGPSFLNFDRQFRTLLFRYTAERILDSTDSIDPEALELLDAFLEGINCFIDREPLPIEFILLGIKPRRFTRLDCVSMVSYMAYSFAYGINSDSLVSMLKRKYPHHNVMELFPGYTREKPVTIMESQAFYKRDSDVGIHRFMMQEIGPSHIFYRTSSGASPLSIVFPRWRRGKMCTPSPPIGGGAIPGL